MNSTSCSSENLPPRTLARVAREVRDLVKKPPEGVRLVVDPDTGCSSTLGEVIAEMEGPAGTPYESRYFHLKLVLPSNYPSAPPRGFFLTKIYHPNVDMSNGAICVNTLKRDWTQGTTFSHVLSVIRCLLIVPFPESSLNDEAGKLFMDSYDEYARRARLMSDVHGRPEPTAAGFGKQCDESDMVGNNGDHTVGLGPVKKSGVLEDSTCDNARPKIMNIQRKENKKKAVEKKNKKKSLKRL